MSFGQSTREEIAALRREVAQLTATVQQIASLVGPMGIPLPDDSMLVQTIHGVKFCIDPMDTVIAPNLMVYRQWEPELSRLMLDAATPDTVFVDVGASFGYFTCLVGSRIRDQGRGRVFAIEPNPAALKLLRRNCIINWSMCPISIHACAISDTVGMAEFNVPLHRGANAALAPKLGRDAYGTASDEVIKVMLKRLDDIIPPGTAVDLMKIDVEGHELSALAGAERVISESPNLRIIMEWSKGQMETAGYAVDDVLELMEEYRLTAHRVPPDLVLANALQETVSPSQLRSLAYDNIILARQG